MKYGSCKRAVSEMVGQSGTYQFGGSIDRVPGRLLRKLNSPEGVGISRHTAKEVV